MSEKFTRTEIDVLGVTFFVTGTYYPEEKAWFDPVEGVGNPGEDAFIEIEKVYLGSNEVGDEFLEAIRHNYEIKYRECNDKRIAYLKYESFHDLASEEIMKGLM
jgi:hypothetical protein